MTTDSPEILARKGWMGVLARAKPEALAALMPKDVPDHVLLRAPDIGSVMVRGRVGATGAPFNLGEVTVTRCALRLSCGTVGYGHVQGRDRDHARQAALVDALMQTDRAAAIRAQVVDPLATAEAVARSTRAAKAAATKVEFFTLVRGEDK